MKTPTIIAVDVDGTLTSKTCWTIDECLKAEMNDDNIKVANNIRKAYENNWILIYTARRDHLIGPTIKWLRRNNIPFHSISNNKVPANWYVDFNFIDPRDEAWKSE